MRVLWLVCSTHEALDILAVVDIAAVEAVDILALLDNVAVETVDTLAVVAVAAVVAYFAQGSENSKTCVKSEI